MKRLLLPLLLWPLFATAGVVDPEEIVALDRMTVAGDLSYAVPLTRFAVTPDLTFDFTLEHRLHSTIAGDVRSTWRIKALETGLYPEAADTLVWRQLGGRRHVFRRLDNGEFSPVAGWTLRQVTSDEFTLSRGAWTLTYLAGQLVAIHQQRGGRFAAEARASRLLALGSDFTNTKLFHAHFRSDGQPVSLTVGSQVFSFTYAGSGELVSVRDGSHRALLSISYQAHLVASLVADAGAPQAVTWVRQPAFARGDSMLRHPVRLRSFGPAKFDYRMTGDVVRLDRHEGGNRRSLFWNIRTGQYAEQPQQNISP